MSLDSTDYLISPRSGQSKKLSTEDVKRVLKLTVERIPHEATHRSLRLMAKYLVSPPGRFGRFGRDPDLKIINDPEFAEKVIEVVGLYMNPPDNAVCPVS